MSVQDVTPERIRSHFVGWQCRIRQIAMRKENGRPSTGMRPRIVLAGGEELSSGVVILMVPEAPEESTDFFRHQVRRTHDPRQVYEKVLEYLQSTHYQSARGFSDTMTATFAGDSDTARILIEAGECILEFSQFNQFYRLLCAVEELPATNAAHAATLWHNRAFNPNLSDAAHILAFRPDWRSAHADPMP
jgi:hypothetical protein